MISTLVRGNLPQETQTKDEGAHRRGSFIYFKDKEIQISSKEKELLKHFKTNELLLRVLTGQLDAWLLAQKSKQAPNPSTKEHMGSHTCDNAYKFVKHDMGPPRPMKH